MSTKKIDLVSIGSFLAPIFIIALLVGFWYTVMVTVDPFGASPSTHNRYAVKQQPVCVGTTCTVSIKMTNESKQSYDLDFFGTHGPGLAERGSWGAYLIKKNDKHCKASPEDSSFDLKLAPNASTVLKLTCFNEFTRASDIKSAEIFGTKIHLNQ